MSTEIGKGLWAVGYWNQCDLHSLYQVIMAYWE